MSSQGNRPDNRSRGNAPQLLEKYKAMARDAQLSGDRVQTEYYLQFAEHYYRVLSEGRARFEEQSRQRGDYASDENEDQEDNAPEAEEREDRGQRRFQQSNDRPSRRDEGGEQDRPQRASRPERSDEDQRNGMEQDAPRPRSRRGRDEAQVEAEYDGERIALDSLPPAISGDGADAGEVPQPRRRTRRPRPDDDAEVAPAA